MKRKETREPIENAIASGTLRIAEIDTTNPAELAAWLQWEGLVDLGEAEAIALSLVRGWKIAIEDRQAQRALDRNAGQGKWINTTNLLIDAVHDARLTVAAADQIFRKLDCYPGYAKRRIKSISSLL